MRLITAVPSELQRRGTVREDVDLDMIVGLAFGSFLADLSRCGREAPADSAERVVATLWPKFPQIPAFASAGKARRASSATRCSCSSLAPSRA